MKILGHLRLFGFFIISYHPLSLIIIAVQSLPPTSRHLSVRRNARVDVSDPSVDCPAFLPKSLCKRTRTHEYSGQRAVLRTHCQPLITLSYHLSLICSEERSAQCAPQQRSRRRRRNQRRLDHYEHVLYQSGSYSHVCAVGAFMA